MPLLNSINVTHYVIVLSLVSQCRIALYMSLLRNNCFAGSYKKVLQLVQILAKLVILRCLT